MSKDYHSRRTRFHSDPGFSIPCVRHCDPLIRRGSGAGIHPRRCRTLRPGAQQRDPRRRELPCSKRMTRGGPSNSCRRSISKSAPADQQPHLLLHGKTQPGSLHQQDFAIDSRTTPTLTTTSRPSFLPSNPVCPEAWAGVDISKREHQRGASTFPASGKRLPSGSASLAHGHTARAQLTVAQKGVDDARALPDREAALRGRPRHVRRHPSGKHRLAESRQRKVTADKNHNFRGACWPPSRPCRLG